MHSSWPDAASWLPHNLCMVTILLLDMPDHKAVQTERKCIIITCLYNGPLPCRDRPPGYYNTKPIILFHESYDPSPDGQCSVFGKQIFFLGKPVYLQKFPEKPAMAQKQMPLKFPWFALGPALPWLSGICGRTGSSFSLRCHKVMKAYSLPPHPTHALAGKSLLIGLLEAHTGRCHPLLKVLSLEVGTRSQKVIRDSPSFHPPRQRWYSFP